MKFLKGWLGEKKTQFNMWLWLNGETYVRFHDVIVPSSNGTSQIDHLLVSPYGLFIIETKNKTGWIFGGEKQEKWTQVIWGQKYQFQNPLKQVYRQKKVLSHFLQVHENDIHTVIYFVGDSKFKTELPPNVLNSSLSGYVKKFKDHIFTKEKRKRLINKLENHRTQSGFTKRDHVRSLKERYKSNTICPKCSGKLLTRTARSGRSAGRQFLGCENFPKCKFTKKL